MVGPDLIRGEYPRGLYVEEPVLNDGVWRVKHVYDTEPGAVLPDLCEVLNAAFNASDVPPGVPHIRLLCLKRVMLRSWTTTEALQWGLRLVKCSAWCCTTVSLPGLKQKAVGPAGKPVSGMAAALVTMSLC